MKKIRKNRLNLDGNNKDLPTGDFLLDILPERTEIFQDFFMQFYAGEK